MPAYNEEAAIASTVHDVVDTLSAWRVDFELIVVDDGSRDHTGMILDTIAATHHRVEVIHHPVNQGYGSALVSGFDACSKDLVFFMDSDGQFDIRELAHFFPLLEEYDAVLGYRKNRQDKWIRKLNTWGWRILVGMVFGVYARDVDCAFKLYPGTFFREHRLETRGAMINTEILYKFTREGHTYTQLGVRHLPRRGGKATGARPLVIVKALRELVVYSITWHHQEQKEKERKQREKEKVQELERKRKKAQSKEVSVKPVRDSS